MRRNTRDDMIWAYLLHLGYNMWGDHDAPEPGTEYTGATPYMRCDKRLWDDLLRKMVDVGLNMVVIDLGDGVQYTSHPEIAVQEAWTVNRLREELATIRTMGLEPIPKLNFSTAHDTWLGSYSRCVSTDTYYGVCRDLIAEVTALFDTPRFFHLGMDEETAQHQRYYDYVVIRQHDLWWHDFLFLVKEVESGGARPWIWSDYVRHHPEAFFKKMPKSVLQSNWYYGAAFNQKVASIKAYRDIDAHGYDQVPTGSNWSVPENFQKTVTYCGRYLASERLFGFLQTAWKPTLEACRQGHIQAVELAGRTRARWVSGRQERSSILHKICHPAVAIHAGRT